MTKVIGESNTSYLVTLADRCSRYYLAERILTKASQPVADKMTEMLLRLPSDIFKTITTNRGKEFYKT